MVNLINNKPKLSLRKNKVVDCRVSTCTNCRRGIFSYHKYEWASNGLVHVDCSDVCGVKVHEAEDST